VVFISDGGEEVRRVQAYLHPNSEPVIDGFHITMRLTVLPQRTKALQQERLQAAPAPSQPVDSIQHLL
jgi:hypothetical protein